MNGNRIDVIKMACEEYSQEVLGFSDVIANDAFLALEVIHLPEVDDLLLRPEGIFFFLNHFSMMIIIHPIKEIFAEIRKALKFVKLKPVNSSIDETLEVGKLKDLPPNL
ncbi:hypothetical protein Tco_0840059 [Tanacetum coccineum]|uniref:Uncharacterized protein n=1 Tax=Tanacetum coccineum TaxID=301880 RepID=A0ABQ5AUY0_9ASTR